MELRVPSIGPEILLSKDAGLSDLWDPSADQGGSDA